MCSCLKRKVNKLCYISINNIHEKNSQFWLAESSAVLSKHSAKTETLCNFCNFNNSCNRFVIILSFCKSFFVIRILTNEWLNYFAGGVLHNFVMNIILLFIPNNSDFYIPRFEAVCYGKHPITYLSPFIWYWGLQRVVIAKYIDTWVKLLLFIIII